MNEKEGWIKVAHDHYKAINFDPTQVKWSRIRFASHHPDSRPIIYPALGPWWESGVGCDHCTVVAYVPQGTDVKAYWPEARDIDVLEEDAVISFSERFPKPDWWPFEAPAGDKAATPQFSMVAAVVDYRQFYPPAQAQAMAEKDAREKEAVYDLGNRIGFGRMMQLANEGWREALEPLGLAGGEFVYGPCAALVVPCGCSGSCGWCEGSGFLTKKVKAIKDSMPEA